MPVVPQLRDIESVVRVNKEGTRPANWTIRDGYSPDYLLENLDEWDYRFRYLSIGAAEPLIKYGNPMVYPAFTVIQGILQEANQVNPIYPMTGGYIYIKVLMENGTAIPNWMFCVKHGSTVDTAFTKDVGDKYYGNYMMTAMMPTYSVWVNTNSSATKCGLTVPEDSAMVTGLGLGGEIPGSEGDRTSFAFTFQLYKSVPPPAKDPIFRR